LNDVFGDGCLKVLRDMRLVLARQTHVYFEHAAARGTDKMVMMLIAGISAEKEHGLPVIAVHAVYQPTAHKPLYRPIDSWKTDSAAQRFGQLILDLPGRVYTFAGVKPLQ
jgi:hypothetical protein